MTAKWADSQFAIVFEKSGSLAMSAIAACLPESGRTGILPLHDIHDGLFWASAVSAGVNECLKLGSGKGCANVQLWVMRATVHAGNVILEITNSA